MKKKQKQKKSLKHSLPPGASRNPANRNLLSIVQRCHITWWHANYIYHTSSYIIFNTSILSLVKKHTRHHHISVSFQYTATACTAQITPISSVLSQILFWRSETFQYCFCHPFTGHCTTNSPSSHRFQLFTCTFLIFIYTDTSHSFILHDIIRQFHITIPIYYCSQHHSPAPCTYKHTCIIYFDWSQLHRLIHWDYHQNFHISYHNVIKPCPFLTIDIVIDTLDKITTSSLYKASYTFTHITISFKNKQKTYIFAVPCEFYFSSTLLFFIL